MVTAAQMDVAPPAGVSGGSDVAEPKRAGRAAAVTTQPAVYTSMLNILSKLGVAKTGTLPPNMGGRPYITAVDVSREVKTLFVEEALIALPSERVIHHEVIVLKDRLNVAIAIEATYTFVSTKDGSTATVTGVGDGLAGGTAVASNIASTNALKNALLRTFLITEQSAEDAAKDGPDTSEPKESRAVKAATQGATAPAANPANTQAKEIQAQIRAAVAAVEEKSGVKPNHGAIGKRLYPNDASWATKVPALKAVLKAIEGGEVA